MDNIQFVKHADIGKKEEVETPAEVVETTPVETPKETTQTEQQETPVIETPKEEKVETPAFDFWQEAQKVDKKELLKKLAVDVDDVVDDEFLKGAVKYYKETGDLTPYLEAKTVDFKKMSPEQVLKYDIDKRYKDLSEEERNLIYKAEVVNKYKLDRTRWDLEDEDYGEEVKIGLIQLKTDAERKRQEFIENQNKFKAPEKQPDVEAQNREAAIREQVEKFHSLVQNDESTKKLLNGKILPLGKGENVFNYEVSQPKSLVDMTTDNQKFFNLFADKDGNYDLDKWYKTVNYALNMEDIENRLLAEGEKRGRAKHFAEQTNATDTQTQNIPDKTGTKKPIKLNGIVVGFE